MKIYDLSQKLHDDMLVYSKGICPNIKKVADIEKDGYEETLISMYSHNGTHIDAPKHMNKNGKSLDEMEINNFLGNALLIDVNNMKKIELEYIKNFEKDILESDFIIFKSGWSKYFNKDLYYKSYPTLTKECAIYLGNTSIKGIGIDMLSVDTYESNDFEIHTILFEKSKVIIENLTNLESLPEKFLFIAAPLKYDNADGSQVRAIGIVNYQ